MISRWSTAVAAALLCFHARVALGATIVSDFEPDEGYVLGSTSVQPPWSVVQGSITITDIDSANGSQAVALNGGTPATVLHADVSNTTDNQIGFLDVFVRPTVVASFAASVWVTTDQAGVRFVREGGEALLYYFDGNGTGGGEWRPTGVACLVDSSGQAQQWVRITIREDYSTDEWDLYVDGTLRAARIGAIDDTRSDRAAFDIAGASSGESRFDGFYAGSANPLFNDADRDGMDDTWEGLNGLNASVDDRNGDVDGDGILNVDEILPDSDQDGIADAWEIRFLGTLASLATDDPGALGRALSESYQQGLSPWPAPIVSTGLRAWYRADVGVLKTSANKVTQWTDLAGSGAHLTAISLTTPPWAPDWAATLMNGYPVVLSQGGSLVTPRPVDLHAGQSDFTIIIAASSTGSFGHGTTLIDLDRDSDGGFSMIQYQMNPNLFDVAWQQTSPSGASHAPSVSLPAAPLHVLSVVKEGTTSSSFRSGSALGQSTVPSSMWTPIARFSLGNRAVYGYSYNGGIAEALVYNRALSPTERQTIEQQLTAKYLLVDSDSDGLSDPWELKWAGNLTVLADPNADPNSDGITNLQHASLGTNPFLGPDNFDFEAGFARWSNSGSGIIVPQAIQGSKAYQTGSTDAATNVLTSLPSILPAGTSVFSAQLSHGNNPGLYVALVNAATGAELARLTRSAGTMTSTIWNSWERKSVTFTLSAETVAYVKIVDNYSGGWGILKVDEINIPALPSGFSNFDFEGGWTGWNLIGEAGQIETFVSDGLLPSQGQKAYQSARGSGVIGTSEEALTTELYSGIFMLTAGTKLLTADVFGVNPTTLAISLVSAANGTELCRLRRSGSGASWERCYATATLSAPTPVFLKISDHSGTGHLAVDAISIEDYAFANLNFEQQLAGWTMTGSGGIAVTSAIEGSRAYQTGSADTQTNTLTSLPFVMHAGSNLFSAQLTLGNNTNLYVALINAQTGVELARLRRSAGTMTSTMWATWETRNAPVTLSADTLVYVKIVDAYTGGWGLLKVDDIKITEL